MKVKEQKGRSKNAEVALETKWKTSYALQLTFDLLTKLFGLVHQPRCEGQRIKSRHGKNSASMFWKGRHYKSGARWTSSFDKGFVPSVHLTNKRFRERIVIKKGEKT